MFEELVMTDTDVQAAVQEKYGAIARSVGQTGGCCGPTPCGCGDPITSNLYSEAETRSLPGDAVAVSLGCGNPTTLLQLEPSAFIRARKPEATSCCGPECCA
jgi:hypothetical protein